MSRSRMTFSSAMAAKAAIGEDDDDLDEEPGEVIESAPPLRVGEERLINISGSVLKLKKKLLKKGRGWNTPLFGDQVTVHYVGMLQDGTKFASTRDRDRDIDIDIDIDKQEAQGGQPRTFYLGRHGHGRGEVAAAAAAGSSGLDDGISTMNEGEISLFTLPFPLPSGPHGLGITIPPAAQQVHFEIELLSWLRVVHVSKDGGIVKKILLAGDDDALHVGDLDQVHVKYQVRLLNGSIVAESPPEGIWFHVNEGHFCPAFTKALKTMRKAEKAILTVQPHYAFGENGRDADNGFPAIPSNAELVIDIEVLSLKPVLDVTGDMMVLKKVLRSGEGTRTPNDGETVRVRYTAKLENGVLFERLGFDEEPFEFSIDEEQVISGLDRAVATMLKGEISQVTVKPEYGFGKINVERSGTTVPADSTLIYEVELLDFTKEKELWEMTNLQKIEAAEKAKQMGNDLYKIGKFQRAAKKYDKAVNYVSEDGSFEGGEEKLVRILRVSCWLNHAACSLKLKDFQETIKLCSKVLDIEFCNVKALYRRAQAFMEDGDLDLAKLDIQKALEVDPENREVKSLQILLKQLRLESNKRDAKLYANMFERMRKDADVPLKRLKVEKAQHAERGNGGVQAMDTENPVVHGTEKSQRVEETDREAQVMEDNASLFGVSSSENKIVFDSFKH